MASPVGESLHESARPAHPPSVPKWVNYAGWAVTLLVTVGFLLSGVMKLTSGPEGAKMMEEKGLSADLVRPLAYFEIGCLVLYLAPATSILGAILFTGYLGGAILTHVRVHEAFVPQMVLGVLVWLGVFFRDYRLRQLIPLRRGPARD